MDEGITVGVGAVVVRRGRLVVVRRGKAPAEGRWTIPGGRLERGETTAEAAVRELAEETGLRGVDEGLCGILEIVAPEGQLVIVDRWVAVEGDSPPVADDDAADARDVTIADLERLPTTPHLWDFLRDHGVLDRMT